MIDIRLIASRYNVDLGPYILDWTHTDDFGQTFPTLSVRLGPGSAKLVVPFEPVAVEIGNDIRWTGFITTQHIANNGESSIEIVGWTWILGQCDIGPFAVKRGEKLLDIARKLVEPTGKTVSWAGATELPDLEDRKADPSSSIHAFLIELVRDCGIAMRQMEDGLTFCQAEYGGAPIATLYRKLDGSNVKGIEIVRNYADFYTDIEVTGNAGTARETKAWIKQSGPVIDMDLLPLKNSADIRYVLSGTGDKVIPNIVKYVDSKSAKNKKGLDKRVSRETGAMFEKCLSVKVEVDDSQIMKANRVIELKDDLGGVDETLWIRSVTMSTAGKSVNQSIVLVPRYCMTTDLPLKMPNAKPVSLGSKQSMTWDKAKANISWNMVGDAEQMAAAKEAVERWKKTGKFF